MVNNSKIIAMLIALAATPTLAADDWMAAVLAKVEAQKTYPRSAVLRGAQGIVKAHVDVDGNGMITSYAITGPTQHDILNREADKLLFKLGQFPTPPDRQPKSFDLAIEYKLPAE